MSNDEQIEEIEVLQSIYPDEFQQITPTSFRIKLLLDPPPIAGTHPSDEDEEPPTLLLHVTYPDAYPDVAPDLDITFDADSGTSDHLSFPEDKPALLGTLTETIEENLGMAMVFTLASTLKDSAEMLIYERATAEEQEAEAGRRREEEKEMEKFRGELVNRERFLDWRDTFFAEKAAAKQKIADDEEAEGKRGQRSNTKAEEKKLSGREMWESGLVGHGDEEEGEDESIDVAKLKLVN